MGNFAIHGFGRIGRATVRAAMRLNLQFPTGISDIKDANILATLLFTDTNYGLFPSAITADASSINIGSHRISYFDVSRELPRWDEEGVDVVVDCTSHATTRAGAEKHLERGAKAVLVSAPPRSPQDADAILLRGINLETFNPTTDRIISMASCTTNALAPVVKILEEQWGIDYGVFATVHAYTSTQSLTDQPMRDRRDSWAAAENIIPSTSGAAKALKFIWPELNITGKAYRVPVRTGSIVELDVITKKPARVDDLNETFITMSRDADWTSIFSVLQEEFASSRIVGETHSSIVDLPLTTVVNGNFVSVAIWYDNEMGYASRLVETAQYIADNVTK